MDSSLCRVCGLSLDFEPWGEDGMTPTYDYCPCCGTEFGVQDWTYEATKQQRQRWLRADAQWDEPEDKPDDWDLAEQLHNVLPDRSALLEALKMVEDE